MPFNFKTSLNNVNLLNNLYKTAKRIEEQMHKIWYSILMVNLPSSINVFAISNMYIMYFKPRL